MFYFVFSLHQKHDPYYQYIFEKTLINKKELKNIKEDDELLV